MFFWLEASGYRLEAFSHTTATYLMAICCSEMRPNQTHSSPLEAAEAGTQTVGHSPQGLQAFPGLPADAALGLNKPSSRTCVNCGPNDGPQFCRYSKTNHKRNEPLKSTKIFC